MPAVTYYAKRQVFSGHFLGQRYTIDLPLLSLNPTKRLSSQDSIALSGKQQSVIARNDAYFELETDHFDEASDDYKIIYEFAESVDQRERFEFDEYGSRANPNQLVTVQLSTNYTRTRTEQGAPIWKFKFMLRVTP